MAAQLAEVIDDVHEAQFGRLAFGLFAGVRPLDQHRPKDHLVGLVVVSPVIAAEVFPITHRGPLVDPLTLRRPSHGSKAAGRGPGGGLRACAVSARSGPEARTGRNYTATVREPTFRRVRTYVIGPSKLKVSVPVDKLKPESAGERLNTWQRAWCDTPWSSVNVSSESFASGP